MRWLAMFGWVLVLTGLAHGVVWLLDGSPPLAGPAGWRKPIVFGLSGGVATLSLAALRAGARAMPRWSGLYGVTMALEIALIDMQAWRGVGSHFNTSTPLDGAIFSLMGLLILVSMVAATVLGVNATRAQREVDLRLSSGLATAAIVIGSAVGIAISVHGSIAQLAGLPPARLGAGEWKLVHAIALHGMQLFPVVAWWLRRRWASASDRSRALLGVGVAWALVLAASFVQLLLRRAPSDPALVPALLAVAGLVVGLVSVTPAVRARAEAA
ncbi:MAG: hypothetical protein JNG84_15355 [Archangium sp.]|nr:hypothetical protein [Archangium sp.]